MSMEVKKYPRISIVTPSYNQGMFLEETIRSILDQKYPNLEFIIIDGGSNDESVSIIKKYASELTYWTSEKDKGQSDAINKGFIRANGEIITFINSDDLLVPGILNVVAETFMKEPEQVGVVHGGSILFEDGTDLATDFGYPAPSMERYLSGMAFPQPAAFYRKRYLDEVGFLRSDLHFGMDYDLFSRLACVCSFKTIPQVVSKYRLHKQSKSVAQQEKFIYDWNKVFVNTCKNLHFHKSLDILRSLKVFSASMDFYYKYDFPVRKDVVAAIDERRLVFYHLCYTIRAFYMANGLEAARVLKNYLEEHYSAEELEGEKEIPAILKKLRLPDPLLFLFRRMKQLMRR